MIRNAIEQLRAYTPIMSPNWGVYTIDWRPFIHNTTRTQCVHNIIRSNDLFVDAPNLMLGRTHLNYLRFVANNRMIHSMEHFLGLFGGDVMFLQQSTVNLFAPVFEDYGDYLIWNAFTEHREKQDDLWIGTNPGARSLIIREFNKMFDDV